MQRYECDSCLEVFNIKTLRKSDDPVAQGFKNFLHENFDLCANCSQRIYERLWLILIEEITTKVLDTVDYREHDQRLLGKIEENVMRIATPDPGANTQTYYPEDGGFQIKNGIFRHNRP